MKRSEATMLVATLVAAYPRQELDQSTINVYADDLLDFDAGEVKVAIETLRRESTFFPSIHEILHLVAVAKLDAPGPAEAFHQASTTGVVRHPLVDRARRMVASDWDWRNDETRFMRKPFADAYSEVLGSAMREIVAPQLAGRLHTVGELEQGHLPQIEQKSSTELVQMPAEVRKQIEASLGQKL